MSAQFLPISSYGFIGNLTSCALVGLNGSMDWCCLPLLDSPSVFAALLDPERGGRFSIQPATAAKSVHQEYIGDTNVLRTEFTTKTGRFEIIDWMHMGGFAFEEEDQHRLPAVYRLVRCLEGTCDIRIVFDPRLNYGRSPTTLRMRNDGICADSHGECLLLYANLPLQIGPAGAETQLTLRAGEEHTMILAYGNIDRSELPPPARSLDRTMDYWQRWTAQCENGACTIPLRWKKEVLRSALVLRVLAGGHGIAAAATTSLPEVIGGNANWDYRFNWIRDTSFTIQALVALGHLQDAREFLDWICTLLVREGRRPADLRVLYPLHGVNITAEEELTHLRGYMDSKPVRIGNAAVEQVQLDFYGEFLETVFRSEHLHPDVDHALSGVLRDIVNFVCDVWREPDHGIWEFRDKRKHYTHSKVMCWVAIDRGIRLAEEHGWKVDLEKWRRERDAIVALVMEKGYSEKRRSFVQSFDSEMLDATALLFPLLEFLPPDHPYALATLATIQESLAKGPFVYRTEVHHGKEGAFGFCSFWLVDALALAGKQKQAEENFTELLKRGNHLGLHAEEIDPATGTFLGNFPQAFTHVGLINSALYLTHRGEAPPGEKPLMGEGRKEHPSF